MKKLLIGVLILILITLSFSFFYIQSNTYNPTAEAFQAMSQRNVSQEKNWIVFEPEQAKANLIFYPGGFVEPESYSVMAQKLSKENIRVFILKMPINLSIINTDAFKDVMSLSKYEGPWFIGGHSLGGTSAILGYHKHQNLKVEGIILLASYGTESADLSDNSIKVLSIKASDDQILDEDAYSKRKEQLPETTEYKIITGGNHSGFGFYGQQEKDGIASISSMDQHEIFTEWMTDFILNNIDKQ
jgi:hypothetical protein